ncbi:MAG: hypothetical protein QHI48_00495 [Bacteroidota bacterium]|nr:hypothetical protein [Bacteroidota bacterium]
MTAFTTPPLLHAQPMCFASGPDSIFFDKTAYNTYLPPAFPIDVTIVNSGTKRIDSVVVFARASTQFTILTSPVVFAADSMRTGDTCRAEFRLLVQPRAVNGIDTVFITVTGKGGMRTECMHALWVEKEYRPRNVLICPPDSALSLRFVDTLNTYVPDPLVLPLRIRNEGDAPSRETRIFYIATPAVTVADDQDPILEIGTLAPGAYEDRVFRIRAVPRNSDTTVTLYFKAQGKGGLGDRIVDTICAADLRIPPRREAKLHLDCANGIRIAYRNGAYEPNPFTWGVRVSNTSEGYSRDARATISLPPHFRLDTAESETKRVGDIPRGASVETWWKVTALPVSEPDTGIICVRILDAFNNTALCCDTVALPAFLSPDLRAACLLVPDTIGVDVSTGLYVPSSSTARLDIFNIGTEGIDSVRAGIIVDDPDIDISPTSDSIRFVTAYLPAFGSASMEWSLLPRPAQYERSVSVTFRVFGAKGQEKTAICRLRIAAALQPEISCTLGTSPEDTLHYAIATMLYDSLRAEAVIQNTGNGRAEDVRAALLLPAGIAFAEGEEAVKSPDPPTLEPGSAWRVSWRLSPAAQRVGRLDTLRLEARAGKTVSSCRDWVFIIGIPPLTVLSIPLGNVAQHGRELRIPIEIDNTNGKSIDRLDVAVTYDTAKLSFLGFEREGDMLAGWKFTENTSIGRAYFTAWCDSAYLEGEGILAHMRYRVLFGLGNDILRAEYTPLVFDTLVSSVNRGSVRAHWLDGAVVVSGDCLPPLSATDRYVFLSAVPDPQSGSVSIRCDVRKPATLSLRLYDILGCERMTLYEGPVWEGSFRFVLQAGTLPRGFYLCRAQTGGHSVLQGVPVIR